jgi:acetyl-CoA/propionyl-CoA carboxylase biotin carboxyl carrier protein
MIRRLLVANRGEIAVRIARACRTMNIESVAVFSDADARAPHVLAADRAVRLGPAPAAESYLAIPRLIDAARGTGADAVHPGYGFLSENADFAAACDEAGLTFVGPPAPVIAGMGSKIGARRLMQAAGVPVVPGETPADQTDAGVEAAVRRVGLPALVKASAGGGGKGMRRVEEAAGIAEAIAAARREALAAFGDGTLYVERLVARPRHVEVQVLADAHGHVVHLFERECSTQRRHQKVIEESPSPALTPGVRERMTAAAVKAATAARYVNAGTIEFLLEGTGDDATFYFLEMNTRLQVEHPVTESVIGVDLVRAQILVAAGQPLPWPAGSLSQRGHAIEARVYAEDPSQGFLPQAGRILLYREPVMPGVRIDSGIVEGSDVTVHYDPLLAKVIASGETRAIATARLTAALRAFPVLGIRTNIGFLLRILGHPRFTAGTIDTRFLDEEGASLAEPGDGEPPDEVRTAIAAHLASGARPAGPAAAAAGSGVDPWSRPGYGR